MEPPTQRAPAAPESRTALGCPMAGYPTVTGQNERRRIEDGARVTRFQTLLAALFLFALLIPHGIAEAAPYRIKSKESDVIRVAKVEFLDIYALSSDPEAEPDQLVVVGQDLRFLLRCKAPGRGVMRMIYHGGQGSPSYAQTKDVECKEADKIVEVRFHKETWLSWTKAEFWVLEE